MSQQDARVSKPLSRAGSMQADYADQEIDDDFQTPVDFQERLAQQRYASTSTSLSQEGLSNSQGPTSSSYFSSSSSSSSVLPPHSDLKPALLASQAMQDYVAEKKKPKRAPIMYGT